MENIKTYLNSDGIMYSEYPPHTNVTLDDVVQEYEQRLEITCEPTPLLVKLHGIISLGEEAQEFLSGPQVKKITKATAIVGDPEYGYYESSNTLISIFQSLKSPSFPIEFFEKEEDALQWLRQFL